MERIRTREQEVSREQSTCFPIPYRHTAHRRGHTVPCVILWAPLRSPRAKPREQTARTTRTTLQPSAPAPRNHGSTLHAPPRAYTRARLTEKYTAVLRCSQKMSQNSRKLRTELTASPSPPLTYVPAAQGSCPLGWRARAPLRLRGCTSARVRPPKPSASKRGQTSSSCRRCAPARGVEAVSGGAWVCKPAPTAHPPR